MSASLVRALSGSTLKRAGHGHGCLCCKNIFEVASQSEDPDYIGIGSSPIVGDLGGPGIRVPVLGTTGQTARYLFRLCGLEIPSGYAIIIRGLRQAATIRGSKTFDGMLFTKEREIESPFWHFDEGNISWHLRWRKNQFATPSYDPAQVAGTSPEDRGLDPVRLYQATSGIIPPGPTLANGVPPGVAVGDLGTFRDIRYPWTKTEWTLSELIIGPGAVVFYASVFQPNFFGVRPVLPASELVGARVEDLFVSSFPNAKYGRVAGSIFFEVFPCCPGEFEATT